jgi:hypothetical protein
MEKQGIKISMDGKGRATDSVMLPEFETKGLVKFKTSNPCCYEHKTNPSPLQC